MQRARALGMATCVFATLAAGCIERRAAPVGPEIGFGQAVSVAGGGVTSVDVLFMIDNSGSMMQEQGNLAARVRDLVQNLASPPDRDGNGAPDWNAVEHLRIGVITSDAGGDRLPENANCEPGGDDGALRGLHEWRTGENPVEFAEAVGATVHGVGTSGCALEQQFEATARAIEVNQASGFPSATGLLAVIFVTDEDDCSVTDDARFFAAAPLDELNVYCPENLERLTPLTDLAAQLRGTRRPEDFVFAAITGVPRDLPADITPEQILALPSMQHTRTFENRNVLPTPVCEFVEGRTSLGKAAPALRIVQFAALIPDSVVTTICTNDFGPAIAEVTARIGARVPGVCLARALPEARGDSIPCEIHVDLPSGTRCAQMPGYSSVAVLPDGRERCAVAQVPPGGPSDGFFYDPNDEVCAQLRLTPGATPPVGAAVDAECFFPLTEREGEPCARSSQCESGYCDPITDMCAPLPAAGR